MTRVPGGAECSLGPPSLGPTSAVCAPRGRPLVPHVHEPPRKVPMIVIAFLTDPAVIELHFSGGPPNASLRIASI